METYIDEADILVSIKKYRDSVPESELTTVKIKPLPLSDANRQKLKQQRSYTEYLADRYDRHKKKNL